MKAANHTPPVNDAAYDVARLRADFPILARPVRRKPLVYLDNAASTQKPRAVIEAISEFYGKEYANVHRGVHWLSQRATERYEGAREKARRFLNAASVKEIIYVRGVTEGINLVASSFGGTHVGAGDEVLVSALEHHSNIVPWQLLCQAKGATLRVIPMTDAGELCLDQLPSLLTPRTRLVAITWVSNALGTVVPVADVIRQAHARGIPVLVDGAQAAPHLAVDVQALDCDFYVFSGHKVYGPTGIGILYGKRALLEAMPPYQGGGDMISKVSFSGTTFNELPYKFEAGTPNIADAVGLGAALDYVQGVGLARIAAHEAALLDYATSRLRELPDLRLVGTAAHKAGVISFVIEGVHPHDIGTILDVEGVAIRAGHHCAMPVMERLGLPATARASFGLYNSFEDVDRLAAALPKVMEIFAP